MMIKTNYSFFKRCLFAVMIIFSINAKSQDIIPYGDLTITPLMGYTVNPKKSNIPSHFLVANGVKGNIGVEIGVMASVFTSIKEARGFFITGISYHVLGFNYSGNLIKLNESKVSNHRHNRFFIGVKLLPIENKRFFAITASAGTGRIISNFSSKNINGRVKAKTGDFSLSITVGLNDWLSN